MKYLLLTILTIAIISSSSFAFSEERLVGGDPHLQDEDKEADRVVGEVNPPTEHYDEEPNSSFVVNQELIISIDDDSHWGHTNFDFWDFEYFDFPEHGFHGFIITTEHYDQSLDDLRNLIESGKPITRLMIIDWPEYTNHNVIVDLKDCPLPRISESNEYDDDKNHLKFGLFC